MTAKWEKLEGNNGVLTIEVDAETVNKGIDEAFKKVVKTINAPGFRKGKMPRVLFEKQYGVESLYQDALDIILPTAYGAAVEETKIVPVDAPEINIEQFEKNKVLIFTAKVVVKPEVQLGDYKGLEVEEKNAAVTDEDIENELKALAERHAELVVKEEGTLEAGDTAVIDFEGFLNGEAFEGGKGENYSLVIGSGTFIPGFEEKLIGLATGEEKEIELTFPEEYHSEELAGKPTVFKVKLHEIKTKVLPAFDDEFAKDVNEEVDSIEALKAKITADLTESKAREAEMSLRDELVLKAVENATIDLPEVMVETEIDRMVKDFENRLQSQGMNLELYAQFSGQTVEALREQMKDEADKRVRVNLVLEAIVAAENFEITEEDVTAELEKMAAMYNMPVDQIKQLLPNLEGVQEDLKMRKAVEFLVENRKQA